MLCVCLVTTQDDTSVCLGAPVTQLMNRRGDKTSPWETPLNGDEWLFTSMEEKRAVGKDESDLPLTLNVFRLIVRGCISEMCVHATLKEFLMFCMLHASVCRGLVLPNSGFTGLILSGGKKH